MIGMRRFMKCGADSHGADRHEVFHEVWRQVLHVCI